MTSPALLRPLRERDFALLFAGMAISLAGDGIFTVALAWLVYDVDGSPGALSLVGLTWSGGLVLFLLLGGVAADRFERRRVMIAADLLRALVIGAMGLLAILGEPAVWQLAALGFFYGVGEAFFSPSSTAIIPQLVAGDDLVQANALQEVARPVSLRLLGPALGGLLVGVAGAGTALLVDAASFLLGIVLVLAMTPRPHPPVVERPDVRRELSEGLGYVRGRPWLAMTLLLAALTLLCTQGPQQVLLPFVVKEDLGLSASTYGLVLTIGGLGSIAGGLYMSRRGMHAHAMRTMFALWGVATAVVAVLGLGVAVWQLAAAEAVFGFGVAGGMVIWATLMQQRVPAQMMGRVSSFDWMVSLGLVPVSYALTGPVSSLIGERATLVAGGLLGGLAALVIWFSSAGLRADRWSGDEGADVVGEARVGDVGGFHADDFDPLARR